MGKKLVKPDNLKSEREITVVVNEEDIEAETEKISTIYRSKAKVKGFRPGKAPMEIVKKMYEKDIREDATEEAIRNKVYKEIEARGDEPVSQIYIKDRKDDGGKINITAVYDVVPQFEFPNLTAIKVEKKVNKVLDTDIDEEIEKLQKRFAKYVPIDEAAKEGLYLVVNYEEKIDGKLLKKKKEVLISLKWGELDPDLFEKFNGKKKGDTVVFEKEVEDKEGKMHKFTLKYVILQVSEEKLPELDENFAKLFGFKTIDELRQKVGEDIKKQYEQKSEDDLEWNIINEIYQRINFELPRSLVERNYKFVLETMGFKNEPEDKIKEQLMKTAEDLAKREVILNRFIKERDIQVSDEELEKEIEKRASDYNIKPEQYRKKLESKGEIESVKDTLRRRKAIDILKNSVKLEVIF